ncbi:MAG TPA: O-antigen ligase family protein [Candidatus Acidoferrales bacterium]|jgi:hypothetical protein|nr:O-antigen ligase family protein [Candidatus Acidoferrales bacterium]
MSVTGRIRADLWTKQSAVIIVALLVEASVLLAAYLTSPLYVMLASLAVLWLVACFLDSILGVYAIAMTIASPFFLYLDRQQSTVLVAGLIAGAIGLFIFGWDSSENRPRTQLDKAAFFFVTYMALNCISSVYRGNNWLPVLNEFIPIAEMYAAYWLASRIPFNRKHAQQLLIFVLALVAARATWQLALFFAGKADTITPPVYKSADRAMIPLFGVWFVRLIDPLLGLHVGASLAIFLASPVGFVRRLAAFTLAATGCALVLSFERAELLAAIVCVLVVLYFRRKQLLKIYARLAIILVVSVVGLTLLGSLFKGFSVGLADVLIARMIDYTRQQLFDPQNSLQQLRLLELVTVKNAFVSAPLVGLGLGSGVGTDVFGGTGTEYVPIHDYFLGLLANSGLVGFGLLTYLVYQTFRRLLFIHRTSQSSFERSWVTFSVVSMVWYGIFVAFHPVFSAYHIPALLGVYVGVTISMARVGKFLRVS